MNKKITSAALAGILVGGGIAASPDSGTFSTEENISVAYAAEENISVPYAEENLFVGMDGTVQSILNDGSEYAVYLAYPQKSQTPYLYNSVRMRSASMIKVFILATAMEEVKDGVLDLNQKLTIDAYNKVGGSGILVGYPTGSQLTLREVLRLMITESDNTATNMMIDLLGMGTINDYIHEKGYTETILQRKMMDTQAIYAGRENYTTVRDLGNFFLNLYNLKVVDSAHDQLMIDFLLDQHDTECLNTACPDKRIAHKTGGLVGSFDDGGIIYSGKNGDTIIVMMSENFTGEKIVIDRMKRLARNVIY